MHIGSVPLYTRTLLPSLYSCVEKGSLSGQIFGTSSQKATFVLKINHRNIHLHLHVFTIYKSDM
jgi:hypothetical protein